MQQAYKVQLTVRGLVQTILQFQNGKLHFWSGLMTKIHSLL